MQDLKFDGIMAGRFIPKFADPYSGCVSYPRLHTSLLWIQDAERLALRVIKETTKFWEFDPISPCMFKLMDTWYRFDTGSRLYCALSDQMQAFTEQDLDRYDHLFCGSNMNVVSPYFSSDIQSIFTEADGHAKKDFRLLRGIWKKQDEVFKSLTC
jgi:hypothetical protein